MGLPASPLCRVLPQPLLTALPAEARTSGSAVFLTALRQVRTLPELQPHPRDTSHPGQTFFFPSIFFLYYYYASWLASHAKWAICILVASFGLRPNRPGERGWGRAGGREASMCVCVCLCTVLCSCARVVGGSSQTHKGLFTCRRQEALNLKPETGQFLSPSRVHNLERDVCSGRFF